MLRSDTNISMVRVLDVRILRLKRYKGQMGTVTYPLWGMRYIPTLLLSEKSDALKTQMQEPRMMVTRFNAAKFLTYSFRLYRNPIF